MIPSTAARYAVALAVALALIVPATLRAQRLAPARAELASPVVEVPIDVTGKRLMVDVRIDGEGPFRFAVDTGGMGMARFDVSLVERLGLTKIGEAQASDGSGRGTRTMARYRVETLRLGDAVFHGIEAASRDYNARLPPEVARVDGILGYHLFRDLLLTLDVPAGILRLERGALPPADGREILELVPDAGVAAIRLVLGGETLVAHLDTGNVGALVVPASLAESLPLAAEPVVVGKARTVTNEFEIYRAPLAGDVEIGHHRLRDPSLSFAEIFRHANLGLEVLRDFSLTFDQKNRRVRFVRDGGSPSSR